VPTITGAATILAMLLGPPALTAQTAPDPPVTREDMLRTSREDLAAASTAPTRSRVERFLYWYDHQSVLTKALGGWHGFHIGAGDFPAGAGMKFGVGYEKRVNGSLLEPSLPDRVDLMAVAAYSTRGYKRLRGGLAWRDVAGSAVDIEGFGQYYDFPQEDFFGLGPDSSEEARTNYQLEAVETGALVRWRPSRLNVTAGTFFFRPKLAEGTDSRYPSIEQGFGPSNAPGMGTETDFLKLEASIALDLRDNPQFPKAGGRYAVTVAQFDDRDLERFDTRRVDVALQQFVPLPDRYRRLALRAEGTFTDAESGDAVPFYLQPTLGGARNLRGFREFRFRDRNSVLVGAEYQWEAWWAMDTALFVDAGTVAPSGRKLSLREMDVSYGVGFRFHSNKALTARLDLAFSREGFIPLLRFDHVF
jgi:hypothetical protein